MTHDTRSDRIGHGREERGDDHAAHGHGAHGHDDHAAHDHAVHGLAQHGHDGHSGHGGGHAGHHAAHVAMFRRLFWSMLVLAVPTVLLSPMFADLVGYRLPDAAWIAWVPPVLGTVLFVVGGRPFLSGAADEIRSRAPGMMLLIALAISVAFLSSLGASAGLLPHELDFWWELALLVVIMLLGHWIEMRSLAQASSALDSLAALLPDEAERETAGGVERVRPDELTVGDVVLVRPGSRVPADGEIVEGAAEVDESVLTGESRSVARTVGDRLVAGSVATDARLRVRVDAVGDDTALAGIRRLVAEAQSSSSRAQILADRFAGLLFWFALGAAVVTAIVWLALGMPDTALVRVISVLVIACPHALGLAIPLVVSIATEKAARAGILVTDRAALEAMRSVDTVLFDKTGTLTLGRPEVVEVLGGSETLALAAAVEHESEHPLAVAIVRAAGEPHLRAAGFETRGGIGVAAMVRGDRVAVGGPALLAELGLEPLRESAEASERGATVLHVLRDDAIVGALVLEDAVRPESAEAIAALQREGVRVALVTGDAEPVARRVARELGIDEVIAGVLPGGKSDVVARLRSEGRRVAMVGDGVNDAPALAGADVGIAIGAGTDVAIASAGLVLASDDPRAVARILALSKASAAKMRQNLAWGAGYNVVAVPLAAGVLAPLGFVLPMEVGALLMSASTVVVAANAQLLRRIRL
ncbi:copper-translocating P-type ATPase [Rathayibacter sp. ZW T2_19]|uniref:Copper-translocating P-type ATPase n=1 Tax=Rathayibacter rubneri TaxID=2950106 RepID=A0A9X2DVE4_9MICO|nr:copper-translocating P-type ATPase [Rathayibacter rubneri]MCM6761897.1 copper-translocating P-type ATPase [Rathayibacter rubneri]